MLCDGAEQLPYCLTDTLGSEHHPSLHLPQCKNRIPPTLSESDSELAGPALNPLDSGFFDQWLAPLPDRLLDCQIGLP